MGTPDNNAMAAGKKLFTRPVEFVAGAAQLDALPKSRLPEVAFVGRSNVGKSSLINAVTGRKALARVSKTPGRTRQINLFNIGDQLMLADLPGYGYAQASKALTADWQHLIGGYLASRANLKRVLLLIDARRGPMDVDHAAMAMLDKAAVSFAVVLTKIDKLSAPERKDVAHVTEAELSRHAAAFPVLDAVSAEKGEGLETLKAQLAALAR